MLYYCVFLTSEVWHFASASAFAISQHGIMSAVLHVKTPSSDWCIRKLRVLYIALGIGFPTALAGQVTNDSEKPMGGVRMPSPASPPASQPSPSHLPEGLKNRPAAVGGAGGAMAYYVDFINFIALNPTLHKIGKTDLPFLTLYCRIRICYSSCFNIGRFV